MYSFHFVIVSQPAARWQELVELYQQRLQQFARVRVTYVRAEKIHHLSERPAILKREAEKILKTLTPDDQIVLCTERGKEYTSEQLAQNLDRWTHQSSQTLCFIIGGPLGIDSMIEAKAHERLALSRLTMPHDLAHVVLLEQLYRSGTILTGKTYHY